ncbi:MAG: hypothetical protein HQK81_00415 [Desulfovibrionaceae bacterium]|nr:hypothetical protein [Desulfovibrionaceae bacterium]MBF0512510.1 hypothetical protein [Desulfovibrionaceae bacterium]
MMRCAVDCRLYGQISGIDRDVFSRLEDQLPSGAASFANGAMEIEYEGRAADLEDFLAGAAALMPPGSAGHLDHIDNELWRVNRYTLRPGGFDLESYGVDDVLDHTKAEGNF